MGVHLRQGSGLIRRCAPALALGGLALAVVPAVVGLAGAARAGSVSGIATLRTPLPVPTEAVFEAVLLDAARADAPARVLGRVRLQPAGKAPYRFTIPFADRDLTPGGRYAVRATLRQGERLLLTTDTVTPVTPVTPGQIGRAHV